MNRLIVCCFLVLLCVAPAFADSILITLDSPLLVGNPGDELIFTGTIAPLSEPVYLNGICVTFNTTCDNQTLETPPFLTLDSTIFEFDVPGTFQPANPPTPADPPYSGPIFGIDIDPSATASFYSATVIVYGGTTGLFDNDPIGSANFNVEIEPEPGSMILMILGLGALAVFKRRFAQPGKTVHLPRG